MAKLNFKQEMLNGPIPGESMTLTPGMYPFDRPPHTTNAEEAIQLVMSAISKPKTTNKILDAIRDKVPVDSLVNVLLQSLWQEGIISIQLIPILAPSVLTIFHFIADRAGLKASLSTDGAQNPETDIDESDIEVASKAIQESLSSPKEDLKGSGVQGLMSRPEGM